jgi:hypothetical protein
VLCKHLEDKALFTAMLRLYAVIHKEMRDSFLLKKITRRILRTKETQGKPLRRAGEKSEADI